jgi:hypothetical protein
VRYLLLFLSLFVVLSLSACGGGIPRPAAGPGAVAPAAAVERFLQLAADKQYLEMGWVFGTEEGPVIQQWPAAEVEKRMYALATVLQHGSFVVGAGSPIPGRTGRAVGFRVVLQRGGRQVESPVVAVQGTGDRWYVEQVDVEALTNVR